MNCDWEEVPNETDARGWRKVRCTRCQTILKGYTPHPFSKIYRDCLAWPRGRELGYWAALLLAVVGMRKERWRWLRWRLGMKEPCGCEAREKWLNTLGGRIEMRRRAISAGLAGWFSRTPRQRHQS